MKTSLRGALGIAAAMLLAACASAGTKRISGTVADSSGEMANGADVGTVWTITKDSFEAKGKLRTDRTGRFSGEVDVNTGATMVLAMDKQRKNAALVLLDEAQIGKPIKLQMQPLGTVSADLDLSAFDARSSQAIKVTIVTEPEALPILVDDKASPMLSYKLPRGSYAISIEAPNAEKIEEKFELSADATKAELGKFKVRPTREFAKAKAEALPAITISDARGVGTDFKLESLKGKWVMIEFWGFW